MSIWEKIKEKIKSLNYKRLGKGEQKELVKKADDRAVIERLNELANAEEGTEESQVYENIDTSKVVASLNDTGKLVEADEGKNELLVEALEEATDEQAKEIIESVQKEEDLQKLADEYEDVLIEQGYMGITLNTFDSNRDALNTCIKKQQNYLRKMEKMTLHNQSKGAEEKKKFPAQPFTDSEIQEILEGLNPESKSNSEIEEKKIQVVALQSVANFRNYGSAFHLQGLTESLQEESKLKMGAKCMDEIAKNDSFPVSASSKINFVTDLFKITDLPDLEKKDAFMEICSKLNIDEVKTIMDRLEKYKQDKEAEKKDKEAAIRMARRKRGALEDDDYSLE